MLLLDSSFVLSGPKSRYPASILHKSIAGRYRPVSYPDGPIAARYRFMQNAYWVVLKIKPLNLFDLKTKICCFISSSVDMV